MISGVLIIQRTLVNVEPSDKLTASAAQIDMLIRSVRNCGLVDDVLLITLSLEGTRILLATAGICITRVHGIICKFGLILAAKYVTYV